MAHNINIAIEDDEWELLQLINDVTDFYGDGYDDGKPSNARPSDEVFQGLVKKIRKAIQQAKP